MTATPPKETPRKRRSIPSCIKKLAEAMHAVADAGYPVKVEIGPPRKGEVVPHDDLDRELAEFEARHGEG